MRLMTTLGGVLALTVLSGSAFATDEAAPKGAAPSSSATSDTGFGGDVNLLVGQKTLHDNDWNVGNGGANLDNQLGAGIMANLGMRNWPVMVAVDLFYSSASSSGVSGNTLLFGVGARKSFALQSLPIVPYAGLGVSYGSGSVSASGQSFSGTGEGLWLDGGAQYKMGKLGLGLDLRWASCPGKFSVGGQSVNADLDGFLAALSVGYGF